MEDMTSTAGGKLTQFRTRYGSSPAAIFTFVASLARTSLECELVQRGGSLVAQTQRYKPRNDCIGEWINFKKNRAKAKIKYNSFYFYFLCP